MRGRYILHGRYLHKNRRPAPHRVGDRISFERMKALAGTDEDETWIQKMLSLAGDAGQEEREEEETE